MINLSSNVIHYKIERKILEGFDQGLNFYGTLQTMSLMYDGKKMFCYILYQYLAYHT